MNTVETGVWEETQRRTTKQNSLTHLRAAIEKKIVGQHQVVELLLTCLLADGHALLEGMPGLAKTSLAKAIADGVESDFHRIQFTPDLLPSDLIGTEIYIHEKSQFIFRQGPLFNNIVLADEINRAPAKVQSALLEAMEEKQVTVGHKSYPLPELYMVIATQNPIEQEGTYQLPEAQLDRFLMHLEVKYPTPHDELLILELDEKRSLDPSFARASVERSHTVSKEEVLRARREALSVHISDNLKRYAVSLVTATRSPEKYDASLAKWIHCGASPRATIALVRAAKALCFLRGDEFVTPKHLLAVAPAVLRHRIVPSFHADADGVKRNDIVKRLLDVVAIP